MLKADFHIHSRYSFDCSSKLAEIIRRCQQVGINCIAIADHGTTEGALKMQSLAPFPVIVAQEILTANGEIMGMFLKETIPAGLSVPESISRIREQGGLVCIQHPFEFTRISLGEKLLEEIASQIDIVEVFNSRSPLSQSSAKSLAFAEKHGKGRSAGSDAHTLGEIGNAYIEMPEFNGKDDFMEALSQGTVHGRQASPFVHFRSLWARIKKRIF